MKITAAILSGVGLMLAVFGLQAAGEAAAAWPPGKHIQRTMGLLADSTPAHRATVRVLFYGQSITQRGWTDLVTADLRARFPAADLIAENRAIGGFSAERLIRTTEADVVDFQPDLMVFHVYGKPDDYAALLRIVRTRTTAEVLVMTDHATWTPDPSFGPKTDKFKANDWFDRQITGLRDLAVREHLGYVDIRSGFRAYAAEKSLRVENLTTDGTHLNAEGCALMARLVSAALISDPTLPAGVPADAVRTLPVPPPDATGTARLDLPAAVRLDLVFSPDAPADTAVSVRIDGQPPSQLRPLRHHGRTHVFAGEYSGQIPPIFQVHWQAPPPAQEWTLILGEPAGPDGAWTFHLTGSVTGPDGSGRTDRPFTSTSGQVQLDPADWNLPYFSQTHQHPLAPGLTIRWHARVTARDTATPPLVEPGLARAMRVAWDLPPGPHHLELSGPPAALAALQSIRIYAPAQTL